MRIAAISDIHGNLAALDAVLADIARRNVDLVVNLGDIFSGALFPRETADRLMPLGFPTIRGNHERQILTLDPGRMGPSDRLAADCLTPDQKGWIAALPETLRISEEVLLVHGTPDSDLAYFLETVDETGLRPATMAEIEARAGNEPARLILCGHTHMPRVARLDDGRLIVNPGSVGLPAYEDDRPFPHKIEAGSPYARYAIAERGDGQWTARLLIVGYDWNEAADIAAARGRQDWARALRTGFA
ncbi:YfcE family phosphodiesterase [Sphingomonas oleivorans]|uniref:YfcE family phosphodiesterase n=1 Tax=Sphingomonas oleivorans TaxID=1735121 RepID=A0A2T5G1T0_9SPHN|nr:metallophosphoesterase family protein [Sphingomonas oleivorans]PTQ13119.1 YfcE family phosphodiesterase [Sphingomonas oleivorans]